MNRPWLSVISPIFNGETYLATALDSILLQNDPDIECLAVDGESTDGTLSILRSYQGRLPLKILERERDSNWVKKTNFALTMAQGEYVCFLHHDDFWLKDRLAILKNLTRKFPQAVLVLHPSNFVDRQGENMGLWSCPLPAAPAVIPSAFFMERLLVQNFISILGPIFKRELALEVGGLDEALWYTADWDFWLKIVACGDALYYPKPLAGFRIHPGSQTVVRSTFLDDFRSQLDLVAAKHWTRWPAQESIKRKIRSAADFSNELNAALAGRMHGIKPDYPRLFLSFLKLGPLGWRRYLRDSRIGQRVIARLKAQLIDFSPS